MADLSKRTLTEWLDDLCVRFILNLPHEELSSIERICFQIEEAQWFYEDFIRPLSPHSLPSLNLRKFTHVIFQHCPLLSQFSASHHYAAFEEFLAYKQRVPVRGAIMLDERMERCVLVKGWKKGSRWSFPRGKINKDEDDLDCAVREVYEETGYDIKSAGLADDRESVHSIEVSMREQHMKLFVFRGVPLDTHFEPRTRKEISAIDWYKLADLPTLKQMRAQQQGEGEAGHPGGRFYMVAPFLGPLKQWIRMQRKKDKSAVTDVTVAAVTDVTVAAMPTDDEAVADKAMAGVEVVQRRNAVEPGNGHLNNLLAGLKASSRPVEPIQQHYPVPDPAEALKRMLSVGQAAAPETTPSLPPPGMSAPGNPILDMLRGKTSSSMGTQQQIQSQQIPQTPLDQIISTPPVPQTPQQHVHHRPPQLPAGLEQPPSFPIPGYGHIDPPRAPQQSYFPQQQPPSKPEQQRQPPLPLRPQPSEQATQLLSLFRNNAREDSVHLRQPRPGMRGPSPNSYSTQPPQPSIVPQASKLPPPTLNAHTMSLLNAFKSPALKPAALTHTAPVQQLQPQVSELSASETSPVTSVRQPQDNQVRNDLPTLPEPSVPTSQPKPQSERQNALLDLFRPIPNGTRQSQLAPQPAELAAQPSPHPPFQYPRPQQPPNLGLQTTALPQSAPGGLTSATVSGPLRSPNLDLLRQQQQLVPVEMGENTPVAPPYVHRPALDEALPQWPLSQSQGPVTQSLSPASNAPELSRQQPLASSSTVQRIEAPQPVPYQILQRPAVLKTPQPGPTSSPSQFDRRGSMPDIQKDALLTLLTGQGGTAGHASSLPPGLKPSSGVMSPVSPLPAGKASLQSSPAAGEGKSRVSSIASLPGNIGGTGHSHAYGGHAQPPVSMIMTDPGTINGLGKNGVGKQQAHQSQQVKILSRDGKGGIGSPTANNPVDKNALLDILKNVAKTG